MKTKSSRRWRALVVAAAVVPAMWASSAAHAIDDDPQIPEPPEPAQVVPPGTVKYIVAIDKVVVHEDGDAGAECGEVTMAAGVEVDFDPILLKQMRWASASTCSGYDYSSALLNRTFTVYVPSKFPLLRLRFASSEADDGMKTNASFETYTNYFPADNRVSMRQTRGVQTVTSYYDGNPPPVGAKLDVTVHWRIINPKGN